MSTATPAGQERVKACWAELAKRVAPTPGVRSYGEDEAGKREVGEQFRLAAIRGLFSGSLDLFDGQARGAGGGHRIGLELFLQGATTTSRRTASTRSTTR